MQTLAVGNKQPRTHSGFTLLELMVVVAIMAIATAGVVLTLRDPDATALEREAQRLVAVLEAGRSQSRASGLALQWTSNGQGYGLQNVHATGTRPANTPTAWLQAGTSATSISPVVLGPEPIIPAQSIVLRFADRSLVIATDGLRPFAWGTADAAAQP